jgi:hypothetical protein
MLINIGDRSRAAPTLLTRFTDCHARVRKFCALARRLGEGASGEEARDAAAQLDRYFRIALPLHVADEEQSLAPRLVRLGDAALGDAIESMTRDHLCLDENLAELLARGGRSSTSRPASGRPPRVGRPPACWSISSSTSSPRSSASFPRSRGSRRRRRALSSPR